VSLQLSTNATAQSGNITGLASLTGLSCKIMLMADVFRELGNSDSAGVIQIATTTGTNVKILLFWSTNSSGNITFSLEVPTQGTFTTATPLAQSAFPANGSPVVIYFDWTGTSSRNINIYTAAGTSIQANNNTANDGALPTTGGVNGAILLNDTNPSDKALACKILGIGIYSAVLTTGNQWTAPSSGDANIVAMYQFTDGTSGTTPSTAASTVPGTSVAITPSGTWNWATDPFWNTSTTITAAMASQVGVTSAMSANVFISAAVASQVGVTSALSGSVFIGAAMASQVGVTSAMSASVTGGGGGGGSSKQRKWAARHLLLFV
jgi:hypothetical protein